MSTIRTDTLQNAAGTKSVPVATVVDGSAKAWVNFNGTGTVAIRAAFNVSSITDSGVGRYVVNFSAAITDANYSVVSSASYINSSTNSASISVDEGAAPTASSVAIRANQGSANLDPVYCNVAIFR